MEDTNELNGFDTSINGNEAAQSDFTIPDEYKEKEWVKEFEGKTGDELKNGIFKSLDEKYSNQAVIPENINDYELKRMLTENSIEIPIDDVSLNSLSEKFKEVGISAKQGQEIFKTYLELTNKDFEKVTNPDELEKNVSEIFKGNKEERKLAESMIREFLPEADRKIIQEIAPNVMVEMFYKMAKCMIDKYEYKESGSHQTGGSFRMTTADKDKEYERICKEMEALSLRPHTDSEKQALQNQLNRIMGL